MSIITDVFKGPYALLAKWGVIALLLLSFGGFCWVKGNQHGTEKLIVYQAKEAIEDSRILRARTIVTEKVVTKYVAKTAPATGKVADNVKGEVKEYAKLNLSYSLDDRWRRVHDEAALNSSAGVPSGAVPAGGTPPTAAEALNTVTGNYAKANRNADRLDALIEWVKNQAKVK